jgi:hypothetical protein
MESLEILRAKRKSPEISPMGINRRGIFTPDRRAIETPLVAGVARVEGRSSGGVPGMGTGLEVEVLYGASW